jgi:hypothetical protein
MGAENAKIESAEKSAETDGHHCGYCKTKYFLPPTRPRPRPTAVGFSVSPVSFDKASLCARQRPRPRPTTVGISSATSARAST